MPIPEKVIVPAGKDPSNGHFIVSLIKSALRLVGCLVAVYTGSVVLLALAFAAAEILGIAEELV